MERALQAPCAHAAGMCTRSYTRNFCQRVECRCLPHHPDTPRAEPSSSRCTYLPRVGNRRKPQRRRLSTHRCTSALAASPSRQTQSGSSLPPSRPRQSSPPKRPAVPTAHETATSRCPSAPSRTSDRPLRSLEIGPPPPCSRRSAAARYRAQTEPAGLLRTRQGSAQFRASPCWRHRDDGALPCPAFRASPAPPCGWDPRKTARLQPHYRRCI